MGLGFSNVSLVFKCHFWHLWKKLIQNCLYFLYFFFFLPFVFCFILILKMLLLTMIWWNRELDSLVNDFHVLFFIFFNTIFLSCLPSFQIFTRWSVLKMTLLKMYRFLLWWFQSQEEKLLTNLWQMDRKVRLWIFYFCQTLLYLFMHVYQLFTWTASIFKRSKVRGARTSFFIWNLFQK